MEIQLSEAWSPPPALQAGTTWRQPGCAMSPQMSNCFLRSPVLTNTPEKSLQQLPGGLTHGQKWHCFSLEGTQTTLPNVQYSKGYTMALWLSQDVCVSWHLWRTRSWTLEKAHSEPKHLIDPGKCLTVTETRISSAHKIRTSFPWETEGTAHWQAQGPQCNQQLSFPVQTHTNSQIFRQGGGQNTHNKLCSTLGNPT